MVRTLFKLYLDLGCVRQVKEEADRLGLRSRRRVFESGKVYGGVPFTRGRTYHLLSNPVYVGEIRHKTNTYDGQHPAIIGHDVWDAVQAKLADNAARTKRRETAAAPSPLAGKFTDETGDKLTPSHAVRRGRRHRYYVSHRLIARSGETDLSGWRLPAATLEAAVAALMRSILADPTAPARLLVAPTPAEVTTVRDAAGHLVKQIDGPSCVKLLATLVNHGRIASGRLSITLDQQALAKRDHLSAGE